MRQKLFQFAVLFHEKTEKSNNREEIKSRVIIEPKTILAMDDKIALLQIAKQISDEYQDKLQDVEILIRPF